MGIALAAKAGYQPTAMNTILSRISKAVELLTKQEEKRNYFNDHPYTPDRVKNINNRAKELDIEVGQPIAVEFADKVDNMIFGDNPNKGYFVNNNFIHPQLKFTLTFPTGWELTNRRDAVGAIHPNRQAFVFLNVEGKSGDTEEAGKRFIQEINEQYGVKPFESKQVQSNNNTGYLVSVLDSTQNEEVFIKQMWVNSGGLMFRLTGVAPRGFDLTMESVGKSFKSSTDTEAGKLKKQVIKSIPVKSGTTIKQALEDEDSLFEPSVVAFINGKT